MRCNPLRQRARNSQLLGLLALASCLAPCCGTGEAHASEQRRSAIVLAVQNARSAIVNIHGQKTVAASFDASHGSETRRVNGMGTGVVVDPRGYIVTNHHVVQGVGRIQVTLADGKTHFARLVSYDSRTDLAVIKINSAEQLPVITVGSSHDLMPGETVIAVGNAYGYEHTVTRGIISALHRTVQVSEAQQYEDLIQTDASINPGNSGGPLLNIDGEMIGVNVAVRAGAQGIGFAIPVDKVLEITSSLMSVAKVDSNWHGIETRMPTKGEPGTVVTRVEANSPAAKGGLQAGDVITQVGGSDLKSALDFERAMIGHKVGEEIDLVVRRKDQPVTLSLVLAAAPLQQLSTEERAWDVVGLRVTSIPAKQFRQTNSRYRGGLLVTDVRDDSPASRQGIRNGDILVGMHIWETVSLENLAYVLNRPDLPEIDPLKFYIVRGQETLFGHLSVASKPSR